MAGPALSDFAFTFSSGLGHDPFVVRARHGLPFYLLIAHEDRAERDPVVTVTDGEDTLAYLKWEGRFTDREKFPLPSVLFLDLRMARLGGFEVQEWLTHHPHLADMLIVVLSGYDSPTEISRAYQLGAHTFLTKPISSPDIVTLKKTFNQYWD